MNRRYWETMAPKYDAEIFDVLKNDASGKIVKAIQKASGKKKSVMDIGCAVGKWIPLLATNFKQVTAADISAINLQIARERHRHFANVDYVRMDMSAAKLSVQPCDVAICINAILTDNLNKRIHFFQSLAMCVNKHGHLILVVPSLESKMFTNIIAHRWKLDEEAKGKADPKKAKRIAENIRQGVMDIDFVGTKHYLEEELLLLLGLEGFEVERIEKINYTWNTEFHNPPKWLKEPYPWDWLCVARRVGKKH